MDVADIGGLIKKRRKFLNITQKDLSDTANVSGHSLIDLETGKGNPTVKQLMKILDALGLEVNITEKED